MHAWWAAMIQVMCSLTVEPPKQVQKGWVGRVSATTWTHTQRQFPQRLAQTMPEPQQPGRTRKVTPLELLGAGGFALLLGAGAGFFSHFVGAPMVTKLCMVLQQAATPVAVPAAAAATAAAAARNRRLEWQQPSFMLAHPTPAGTAKQLAEDGIDPRTRLRFLPIAVSLATAQLCGWKAHGAGLLPSAGLLPCSQHPALVRQQHNLTMV